MEELLLKLKKNRKDILEVEKRLKEVELNISQLNKEYSSITKNCEHRLIFIESYTDDCYGLFETIHIYCCPICDKVFAKDRKLDDVLDIGCNSYPIIQSLFNAIILDNIEEANEIYKENFNIASSDFDLETERNFSNYLNFFGYMIKNNMIVRV